jgi:hypothetical protein
MTAYARPACTHAPSQPFLSYSCIPQPPLTAHLARIFPHQGGTNSTAEIAEITTNSDEQIAEINASVAKNTQKVIDDLLGLVRCSFLTRILHSSSHACSLEASMSVANSIPLGCSLPLTTVCSLPLTTVNCVKTLKVVECTPVVHVNWTKPE